MPCMEKTLNKTNIDAAMTERGLTQTALAETLGVSREAVSQWLKNKSFPRPDKLLRLGKLLSLSFNELVEVNDQHAPVVAFRKMKGTKTTADHIKKAQEMGLFLKPLVNFLPYEILEVPPVLKSPNCDYEYLQQVAQKVRSDIHVGESDKIDFTHLIRRFGELQTVIIPVLWGSKVKHQNATHIYLPDSQTTWVYLNLDTNIHDFKFWMAHELGHCLSPSLKGNDAEDFADAFAGALLFPQTLAKFAYASVVSKQSDIEKVKAIVNIANKHVISPYTVFLQINKYAESAAQQTFAFASLLHSQTTNFNKKFPLMSKALLGGDNADEINPKEYLAKAAEAFDTAFFEILKKYLHESKKGFGYVQSVMDIPLLDAQSIYAELT